MIFLVLVLAVTIALVFYFGWPCILLFVFALIIKTWIQYKKYGSSIFRAFKTKEIKDENVNLICYIINQNKEKQHFIYDNKNTLIWISKSGVYLIKILEYTGRIVGDINNEVFTLKEKYSTTVPNFFFELDKIEKLLNEEIESLEIKKMIVKKENCMIEVPYDREYQILGVRTLYNDIQIKEKKTYYSEDQIVLLESQISKILSAC